MTDQQNEILSLLDESQSKAVTYCDGPALVIAGAGSGKTRVLTYKIAYLLSIGLQPWNILALTFTSKAAREMKERVGKIVGEQCARRLFMGTFHSIFSRILRTEAQTLNYTSSFTIYDDADSRSLIKAIIKELGLDDKVYKPATVANRISMAKNHLILPTQYAADHEVRQRDREQRMPSIYKIYSSYQVHLQQSNAMDFDDLLVNTFLLFRDHSEIREKYASKFQYILVDEYQDTNSVQVSIVRQLSEVNQRVCVVGDDYQSIYSFRGANIDNILDFQKKFPHTKLFKLERNYRSTQRIVCAANSLMKHNQRQIAKEVYSQEAEGEQIIYHPCYSDKEEAMVVIKEMERIKRKEHCEYDAFAILYRTNAQSRSFEDELRKHAIPYVIYGGLSFYQRKEIKDILAYFRLTVNPDDSEAIRRVINYPARGIGNTTMLKVINSAAKDGVSLWEVINNPSRHDTGLGKAAQTKLLAFRDLITKFTNDATQKNAFEVGQQIVKESGIFADLYGGSDAEAISRQENLEEFLAAIQTFVDEGMETDGGNHVMLSDFLQEVALVTDQDRKDDDTPKVKLMTIHASKGLEFPTVFIVGLEENIFPSPMSSNTNRGLEEERRLLYVAITRAERHCYITNAQSRFRFGSMQFDSPSRFLADIDPRFLKRTDESSDSMSGSSFRSWGRKQEADDIHKDYRTWKDGNRQREIRWQKSTNSQHDDDQAGKSLRRHQQVSVERQLGRGGSSMKSLGSVLEKSGGLFESLSSSVNSGKLCVGAKVEHPRFGVGVVMGLSGDGENAKATVDFANVGRKQLLLKFAKLRVLS